MVTESRQQYLTFSKITTQSTASISRRKSTWEGSSKDYEQCWWSIYIVCCYPQENAKEDCKLSHDDIDELCQKYSDLYVLWDGAFSYVSTMNPTIADIVIYERFVTAAVHLHKDLGMNVTPKVHLMWKQVKHQMKFPTGLSTNTKLRGG